MKKNTLSSPLKRASIMIYILVSFVTATNAATYYVREDGNNDANNGHSNSPEGAWGTIDFAADNVPEGSVIRVQTGTFEERVTPAVNKSVTFVADGPVTVCGFEFSAGSDAIRVIGFTIDTDFGNCTEQNSGILLNSGVHTNLEFWHNTIRDASANGIRQSGWPAAANYSSNTIVIGNTIHNIGIGSGSGVGISFPPVDSLIAYNTVYDTYPDAFYFWGKNTKWLNNHTYNLKEDYGGHSDVFQNGSNYLGWENNLIEATFQIGSGDQGDEHTCIVQNNQQSNCVGSCGEFTQNIFRFNVWHNVSNASIGIDGPPVTHTYIYNNTTAEAQENSAENPAGHYLYQAGVDRSKLYNNLEYEGWGSSKTTNVQVYYLENDSYGMDYNLAYDPDGPVTFATSWSALQSKPQTNADPDLWNYDNDDFSLGSSSQAIENAGPLTTTNGLGSGTVFQVATDGGGFFRGDNTSLSQYGGNLIVGDEITVGDDTVRILSIDGDEITVVQPFTWAHGEEVYFGHDTSPDIGAYPYKAGGYELSATFVKNGDTVNVTPNDASLVRFVVVFENEIPVGVDSIGPYSVSGVGSGTLKVRVYPLYAGSKLFVEARAVEAPDERPMPPTDLHVN